MGRVKGRPGLYREGAAPPELPRFLFNRFPGLYRGGALPPEPPRLFRGVFDFFGGLRVSDLRCLSYGTTLTVRESQKRTIT